MAQLVVTIALTGVYDEVQVQVPQNQPAPPIHQVQVLRSYQFIPSYKPPKIPDYKQIRIANNARTQYNQLIKSEAEALEKIKEQQEALPQPVPTPGMGGMASSPVIIRLASNTTYQNDYAFGQCTWYVASKVNVPPDLGNANQWDFSLRNYGWTISSVPIVGSIAITHAGPYGHVAYVEQVTDTQVQVSEMNFYDGHGGGFDKVDYRWTPISDWIYAYR